MDIIDKTIDELKLDLLESIKRMVKIPSIEGEPTEKYPFGENPALALEEALKISKELGFKVKNLDNYIGYAEYGEGEEYIGILGHVDIVPEGNGWTFDPFGGEIKDGRMYGRGVLDNKGPTMCTLYGLKAIKDLDLPISKKIRIIFGTNEETGFKDIPHYLENEKPPIAGFTPDCKYPAVYGERGICKLYLGIKLEEVKRKVKVIDIKGIFRDNMVPDFCEIILKVKDKERLNTLPLKSNIETSVDEDKFIIKSYGKSSAGNTPYLGENAITNMLIYLLETNIFEEDINGYLNFIKDYIHGEFYGEKLGIDFEDEVSGKLLMNISDIIWDKNNIRLGISIRYPIHCTFDSILTGIENRLKENISVEKNKNINPVCFPKDHPMLKILKEVYEEKTGMDGTPVTTTGGTYAKVMPSIVAFGPSFPGQKGIGHNPDEYMDLDDIILNAKIYAHAIYRLAK